MTDTTNSVTDALSYLAASKSAILSGEPWTPTMQEMCLAASNTIDTLRDENMKLREALETLAEYVDERTADNECRPLENARAALAATKTGEQHDNFCT